MFKELKKSMMIMNHQIENIKRQKLFLKKEPNENSRGKRYIWNKKFTTGAK